MPQVTIEESVKETPKVTIKKLKERMRANKKLKKQASEAKVNSSEDPPTIYYNPYPEYSNPDICTAKEDRAYKDAKRLAETKYFYPMYSYPIGPEVAPTPDVSGTSAPKPRTLSSCSRLPPRTPRMSRLEKEAAKNARNTPKTVSISPAPLPQAVEAEPAPTTGIPPMPVPLDPASLPQDIETAGVPTPEPTTSPLEAVPPAQVTLTSAQTTAANAARNRMLNAARLLHYRQGFNSPKRLISEALNSAARTSILTKTTRSQHVRLQKRNLTALSIAKRELLKATTLKEAPSPPSLDKPGLTAKEPIRKRKMATNPLHLHKAATSA